MPAKFWIALEQHYRHYLAAAEDRERLQRQLTWLTSVPVAAMVKAGWVAKYSNKLEQLREVLSFFGVASPEQWELVYARPQATFRRSEVFESDAGALSAWLRQGVIQAQQQQCGEFDKHAFRSLLADARSLTTERPTTFLPALSEMFGKVGVAIVVVPRLPRAPVSGVARWLSASTALIQLSPRYKTDDQFWFTFFHEAGHILLHGKREVFLEAGAHEGKLEDEANRFAADLLIPPISYRRLRQRNVRSKEGIRHFAGSIGVSPGIVVGRLQHDGALPRTHCNDLKVTYDWDTELQSSQPEPL